MLLSLVALIIGFILDLLFGDPIWMPHIVRAIGNLISIIEKILRRIFPKNREGELIGGVFLVLFVLSISTGISIFILYLAGKINIYFKLFIESLICYQLLATKSLKDESMKVYKELEKDDLVEARKKVSMIVGRDTESLSNEGVTKATVETIAENISDGIIAPMLFMVIGGGSLGVFYKAANTMDSMVGYKNDKYLYFGRVAAKLDDVLNFIPSRVSAYLMIVSSLFMKLNSKNAYRIFKRDRFNHASPNSAQTEAVCAGALEVQLAGDAYYFGELYKKKTIGDCIREIRYDDIKITNRLLYITSTMGVVLFSIIKLMVIYLVLK
ncbi:adenosylcobinamide-phosphate synthase CbiB [Clostridium sp. SHJSY1]|uniref:adenosylcobinamide-phosphate synthase CbiB n=1 Tax=Clostridium sp. SHJSY1 TaxID=2942483 RepID=UPI00287434CE|nr:adenosylcobinamide-phosphate synthase CbiB [Clostridium sp. SHJSY1]MDS0526564.1 adenosylcobinamide-phosphate synthase CbiB [Clostridium sp. SHJSY1]